MDSLIKCFALKCIALNIIEPKSYEWLVYSMLKRLTTWVTWALLILVGGLFFGFVQTIVFGFCFLFLRACTNGFHATSYMRCLFLSLCMEICCLWLSNRFSLLATTIFLIISDLVVWFNSPSNNACIHLSIDEICALRKKSRIRLIVINLICLFDIIYLGNLFRCVAAALIADAISLIVAHYNKVSQHKMEDATYECNNKKIR